MRRAVVALILVIAAPVVFASDESTVTFDARFDFSIVATFTIRPANITFDKPEINNRLFEQQLHDVLRRALSLKRLKEVADSADLVVRVTVTGQDYSFAERRPGTRIPPGPRGSGVRGVVIPGAGPVPAMVTEGTITIEMMAARTGGVVWRGSVRNEEESAPRLARALPKNAADLLSKYPPPRN
jgi:hypothetical protein